VPFKDKSQGRKGPPLDNSLDWNSKTGATLAVVIKEPMSRSMASSSTSTQTIPWHAHLTLDVIATAARYTVLHPGLAWMLPLSLRAVTIPYHDSFFVLATVYAFTLTIYYILAACNQRYAFGPSREVDLSEEVIVITGGVNGLGRAMADFYRMHGAAVAVLDISDAPSGMEEENGVEFYKCDVGNSSSVNDVAASIRKDVRSSRVVRSFVVDLIN